MLRSATDAELSLAEGILRAAARQGQDAFAVDPSFVANAIAELRRLRSGEFVQIPKNRSHAEAMNLISERWLRDNPNSETEPRK